MTLVGPLLPHLSEPMLALIRTVYGGLLFATLLLALPHARRFYVSARWGGYAAAGRWTDWLQSPVGAALLLALWFGAAGLLMAGTWTVAAAMVNVALCRYFHVQMRWRSLTRGMGAPGFMTYWVGGAVLLLEVTRSSPTQDLALLVLQVDFALVILSAGLYKVAAGYLRNEGFELGLVNPEWGHWHTLYRRLPPRSLAFQVLNQLAWSTEVLAAALMVVPSTRWLGGLALIAIFAFIATQIRLGLLCEMVMLAGCLYLGEHSPPDRWVGALPAWLHGSAPAAGPLLPATADQVLEVLLWAYLLLLPLAHAGLSWNFYARRALPWGTQRWLERYTNFFGIIIWRVFTLDVINFFPLVYVQRAGSGARELVSRYGWGGSLRYNHVVEAITMTSVFTALKYYPSRPEIFRERLVRYARTIPRRPGDRILFEVVSIRKTPAAFAFIPMHAYLVDPTTGEVVQRPLDEGAAPPSGEALSVVHECSQPGSYAPAKR